MYSGKHFRARLAATCHSGAVGGGEQFNPDSNAHPNPDCNTHAHAHSHSNPNSYAYTHQQWWHLCRPLELHDSLSWRQCGERGQQQLYGAVLESGLKSNDPWQQRPCRDRRSLVFSGALYHGHSDTNAKSNAYAETYAYTEPDPYAQSR